jgi:arsenical pump membrane protein
LAERRQVAPEQKAQKAASPKIIAIGSLATLFWLHVLASKGTTTTWGQYMNVGQVITPPMLLVVVAALALSVPVVSAR